MPGDNEVMCDEHEEIFNESGMSPDPYYQITSGCQAPPDYQIGGSDFAELLDRDPAYQAWADSYSEEVLRTMDADASFLLNLTKSEEK